MAASFLSRIRVLDLSQYIPGPYASLMLADLGADVVKVEPPAGDPMRFYGSVDGQVSPFYGLMNNGKRVIRLDLKSEEGRAKCLRLLAAADILIESYRPGVLDRLGLGRGVLERAAPRLIHCSISAFGSDGPFARKGAHDVNSMAMGGGLALSGTEERPVISNPPVADYASALQSGLTVLAALVGRESTGRGSYIDLSITDTVLAWQSWLFTDYLRGGSIAARGIGEASGGLASYNLYRTSDGRFISIGADEDKFWEKFCVAVGRPDWTARKAEPAPQRALIAEVEAHIGSWPLAHWAHVLADVDCCCQPVLDPTETIVHPQIEARRMIAPRGPGEPVECLYPAWIDGRAPDARPRYDEVGVDAVLQSWNA